MTQFDDIRPYNDSEVRATLDRILNDPELIHAVASLRFPGMNRLIPWLIKPAISFALKKQFANVNDVRSFQDVIEKYMRNMIETTTAGLTVSGLDLLDPGQSYVFISNHRDITMDPALVNWTLYNNGHSTVRIAIGDNLLTKPYVSDLMRLNKSFIVNRSATSPREKLKAARHLSHYIHHSIKHDRANIWIAQREGRAKDGLDQTNSAVVSMLALSRPKPQALSEYINELNIVPVSISYELDPCDGAKAKELFEQREHGSYEKQQHEDVASIATGIAERKGRVHVAYGKALKGDFANTDEVANAIDQQIINNYVLFPSHVHAYHKLNAQLPPFGVLADSQKFDQQAFHHDIEMFDARVNRITQDHRQIVLEMYANPIVSKLKQAEIASH